MNKDLAIIKKYYGEKMMQLCRRLFPTLLEQEGELSSLLLRYFEPSRFLYDDIIYSGNENDFQSFIYSFVEKKKKQVISQKKPEQLLSEAGYILYRCKNNKDVQRFKEYFAPDEELCTFDDEDRIKLCHIFFAVKKNVDEIKRENFTEPERQDEYGTSVISLQFTKDEFMCLSIKNRYNHTVDNPDATFGNNLDNIIPGLASSFERTYGLKPKYELAFELPGYVRANDGKYYKYNYEINNVYYCPNNIVIDNFKVKRYEPLERYIVLDYFVLDLKDKKIELYDSSIKDCFLDGIKNIKKINVLRDKHFGYKTIEIITEDKEPIIITIDSTNKIIEYNNNNLTKIGDNFLHKNLGLSNLCLNNVTHIGNNFLCSNREGLTSIRLLKTVSIGDNFLSSNFKIKRVELPNVEDIGDSFLEIAGMIRSVNNIATKENNGSSLEMYQVDDDDFSTDMKSISLPKVKRIGKRFLYENRTLKHIDIPSVEDIGDSFLFSNEYINRLYLPNAKKVGSHFMDHNTCLCEFYAPNLEEIGKISLNSNNLLTNLILPNLKVIHSNFLSNNNSLRRFSAPNVKNIGMYFLPKNQVLEILDIPDNCKIRKNFLKLHPNFSRNSYTSFKKKIIGHAVVTKETLVQAVERAIKKFKIKGFTNDGEEMTNKKK